MVTRTARCSQGNSPFGVQTIFHARKFCPVHPANLPGSRIARAFSNRATAAAKVGTSGYNIPKKSGDLSRVPMCQMTGIGPHLADASHLLPIIELHAPGVPAVRIIHDGGL
jgi:hypothetical protein